MSALCRVLRSSADTAHRALAAQVLGYVDDKQAVVGGLVRAMSDPSEEVRNNAMRALMVFADAVPDVSGSVPRVPAHPFIEFLESPVWSGRNKASGALMTLSKSRDPELLARLRKEALTPLVEMRVGGPRGMRSMPRTRLVRSHRGQYGALFVEESSERL